MSSCFEIHHAIMRLLMRWLSSSSLMVSRTKLGNGNVQLKMERGDHVIGTPQHYSRFRNFVFSQSASSPTSNRQSNSSHTWLQRFSLGRGVGILQPFVSATDKAETSELCPSTLDRGRWVEQIIQS
ncbi:hypothetical protein T4B_2303 [Trichinella pseudospiralis]|uniref:Uncharacterized protein n=1 Tax=Trichinella pseudospiralis TaxID=6337 RepID=A0A0V1GLG7_TRIPS|nr:hypothetical protein T4B_2303 [Trichinella pseudospiralis]